MALYRNTNTAFKDVQMLRNGKYFVDKPSDIMDILWMMEAGCIISVLLCLHWRMENDAATGQGPVKWTIGEVRDDVVKMGNHIP